MDQKQLEDFIVSALAEDVGDGDHTSLACIPEDSRSSAKLLVKDVGLIAGVDIARAIFKHVDPDASIDVHISKTVKT